MRRWPSLIAAVVDLIDWRRWNLTPDQGRDILLRAPLVGRGEFSPAAVQGPAKELMDISNRIDREWRELLSSDKLRIEGINSATGSMVSLPGAIASMAYFSFGPGVLVLPGADGACVLVAAVIEQSAGAPSPKRTRITAVQDYLAEQYPNCLPISVPVKQIAHATGVSENTVRRALKMRQHR
jgi:hypothetical protein